MPRTGRKTKITKECYDCERPFLTHSAGKRCAECKLVYQLQVAGSNQQQAIQVVAAAVDAGWLVRANICSHCGDTAGARKHHFHHYLGYARRHWLTVVELCRSCHQREHREQDDAAAVKASGRRYLVGCSEVA